MESFTVATFAGRLGETFRVHTGSKQWFDTILIEAEARPGFVRGERRVPFSLVFRAAPDILVPQGMYRVEHPELGESELFIVPIGPDDEGMCYEAVFG